MTKGIRHSPSDSLAGRKLMEAKGSRVIDPNFTTLTKDQIDWNNKVELKRKQKEAKWPPSR